jgi:hypothetical protein
MVQRQARRRTARRRPDGPGLIGGRLDSIDGKAVASIVYPRRAHVTNLFIGQLATTEPQGVKLETVQGFNIGRRSARGLDLWAVSDIAADELREFVALGGRAEPVDVSPGDHEIGIIDPVRGDSKGSFPPRPRIAVSSAPRMLAAATNRVHRNKHHHFSITSARPSSEIGKVRPSTLAEFTGVTRTRSAPLEAARYDGGDPETGRRSGGDRTPDA